MKRSISRSLKVSDLQELKENTVEAIPEAKWKELVDIENSDLFILGIREEILQNCMKICHNNYLEKQVVSFTVHCAYLAWIKVLDVYYMFKDSGDFDDFAVKESWQPDEEPEPSVIDSWGSHCIDAIDPTTLTSVVSEEKQPPPKTASLIEVDSLESSSFASQFFGEAEETYFYQKSHPGSATSLFWNKSIFTRTLSMSKDSLPVPHPSAVILCEGNKKKKPNKN